MSAYIHDTDLLERAHIVADAFARRHGIAADWLTGPVGGLAIALADFARDEIGRALAAIEKLDPEQE